MDLLALLLDDSEPKVGVCLQNSLQLGWERVGFFFGVEKDCCFMFFPMLSVCPVWETKPRRLPRARDLGQQAMGCLRVVPKPGEEVWGGGSHLFKTLHPSPTPVLPTPLPPRALYA